MPGRDFAPCGLQNWGCLFFRKFRLSPAHDTRLHEVRPPTMFSRILASILTAVALHAVFASVLLAYSVGGQPPPEKIYRVMLVDVIGSAADAVPVPAEPVLAKPVQVAPAHTPFTKPEPEPVSERTRPELEEARKPKRTAKKANQQKKPDPVLPAAVEVPVPPAATDLQADATAAAQRGGGQSKTVPSIFIGGLAAYAEDAVDERPYITRRALPEYPSRAKRMNIQGRVEIRLVIDAAGMPRELSVHSAEPRGFFEDAALQAAKKTRFSPGKVKGRPVNTVVIIPFVFSLR